MKKSELIDAVKNIPEGKEKLVEILKQLFPTNTSYSNGTMHFYRKDGTDAVHIVYGDFLQGCFEGRALFSFYINTIKDIDYFDNYYGDVLQFELDNEAALNLPV